MNTNIIAVIIAVIIIFSAWIYKHHYKSPSTISPPDIVEVTEKPEVRTNKQRVNQAALFRAIKLGDEKKVLEFLTIANINQQDANGNTALHLAVSRGNYDIVTILLQNGANINMVNSLSQTVLHIATIRNRENIIPLLIMSGVDYTLKDKKGKLALNIAIGNYSHRIIKMLRDLQY